MNEKTKKTIFIIFMSICITCSVICAGGWWYSRSRLRSTREELDTVTERLTSATNTNRQLTDELKHERAIIEDSKRALGELSETTQRSTRTIQDCIELVRDIREKVKELEASILDRSTNINSSNFYNTSNS